MSANYVPIGVDFTNLKMNHRAGVFANYKFAYQLPDEDGNLLDVQFNKIKTCDNDGNEYFMWVLSTVPFEVK